jgi:hypothetical protein
MRLWSECIDVGVARARAPRRAVGLATRALREEAWSLDAALAARVFGGSLLDKTAAGACDAHDGRRHRHTMS